MQTCIIHLLKEQQQSPKFMALHNHFLYCFPDVKAGLEHNRGHLTIFRKVFWKISRRVRGLIFHLFPHYLLEEIASGRPSDPGNLGSLAMVSCSAQPLIQATRPTSVFPPLSHFSLANNCPTGFESF